jgi:hypothetical protein
LVNFILLGLSWLVTKIRPGKKQESMASDDVDENNLGRRRNDAADNEEQAGELRVGHGGGMMVNGDKKYHDDDASC